MQAVEKMDINPGTFYGRDESENMLSDEENFDRQAAPGKGTHKIQSFYVATD